MSKIYLCDEKKWVEYNNYYIRCVSYFDGEYLEYGYCNPNLKHKMIYICDALYVLINPEFLPESWIYNESVGYWYISPDLKRYHRSSFTKDQLIKKGLAPADKSTWTEGQIMAKLPYLKIYDSGAMRWVLELPG